MPALITASGYQQEDKQGELLYAAEDELMLFGAVRHFTSLDGVVSWLNARVLDSAWWDQHHYGIENLWISGACVPELGPKYASAERKGSDATLFLPRHWAWNDVYVLHELCHAVTYTTARQAHGPLYARRRLEVQYEFGYAGTGEVLEDAFREHRVRF